MEEDANKDKPTKHWQKNQANNFINTQSRVWKEKWWEIYFYRLKFEKDLNICYYWLVGWLIYNDVIKWYTKLFSTAFKNEKYLNIYWTS